MVALLVLVEVLPCTVVGVGSTKRGVEACLDIRIVVDVDSNIDMDVDGAVVVEEAYRDWWL